MGRTRRRWTELAVRGLCLAVTIACSAALFLIIGSIFLGALPSLNLHFLLTSEAASGKMGMGLLNSIEGTILLSSMATIIAIPFALGTALYLQRYARPGRLVRAVRFYIEVLSGTPSIVLGMFGFLIFVYYLKSITGGYSLISASIALAILIAPVLERAAEDAIATVPRDLEEGSYAVGATRWQTIHGITLPVARSGIVTGIILAFGRAAEESAVVLLTTSYTQFSPELGVKADPSLFLGVKVYPFQNLVGALPISVYNAYEYANIVPISNGFAAAFVLIMLVLAINLAARAVLYIGASGEGRPLSARMSALLSSRRVDRVAEPLELPPDGQPVCPFQELEREVTGGQFDAGDARYPKGRGPGP